MNFKLHLKRETVRKLTDEGLRRVVGGDSAGDRSAVKATEGSIGINCPCCRANDVTV